MIDIYDFDSILIYNSEPTFIAWHWQQRNPWFQEPSRCIKYDLCSKLSFFPIRISASPLPCIWGSCQRPMRQTIMRLTLQQANSTNRQSGSTTALKSAKLGRSNDHWSNFTTATRTVLPGRRVAFWGTECASWSPSRMSHLNWNQPCWAFWRRAESSGATLTLPSPSQLFLNKALDPGTVDHVWIWRAIWKVVWYPHCLNPEVRIGKKIAWEIQGYYENTLAKSLETIPRMIWLALSL